MMHCPRLSRESISTSGLFVTDGGTMTFGWTDFEDIAIELVEQHGDVDPTQVSFPQLKAYVEGLENFEPTEGQRSNEQILEAIQAAWIEERADVMGDDSADEGYSPMNPFR